MMRLAIPVMVFSAIAFSTTILAASPVEAASCSSFVVIKSYDANAKTVEVSYERGSLKTYFPRPEGSPNDSAKIPKPCSKRVTKTTSLVANPTGGRMTVTQVRANFSGKMLNDTEDPTWLPGQLETLIKEKTPVIVVIRPGMKKDSPLGITTLYLPITDEEQAEIERLEKLAEDA